MKWRPAVFWWLARLAHVCHVAGRGFLQMGAGVLDTDDLGGVIGERWKAFGLGESYVDAGFFPWEGDFYGRFLEASDSILVVGCGTGRDLIALLRAGHAASGLEVASEAAARARAMLAQRGLRADVITGGIEDTLLPVCFDAIVFSWCCYSYIPSRARRVAVLRKAHSYLKPGGRILLSYVASSGAARSLTLAASVATITRSSWRPEPGDGLWSVNRGLHFEHAFLVEHLEGEARDAGLEVLFHGAPGAAATVAEVGTIVLKAGT